MSTTDWRTPRADRGKTSTADVHSLRPHYDVVIAGARCAGASTAMLLARRGLRVLAVDPLPRGRDTLSTHALMRGGVVQLHRWGLLDKLRQAGTPTITSTTFDYADEAVTVPIDPSDGIDGLYAPRRTVLDPLLAGAAEVAGATVVHGLAVVDLERDPSGRVRGAHVSGPDRVGRSIRADLVIGADGVRSRVARLVGAPVERETRHTTASIYGYWRGLPRHENRWYFRAGLGLGTIPTNDGAACVFASVPPEVLMRAHAGSGVESLFREAIGDVDPALADHLATSPPVGPLRAFAGTAGFLRTSTGPGWALVGDAGYFKDPITAHGITDALRDAELLAGAVEEGSEDALRRYQEERDAVSRGFMDLTDRIASLDWDTEEVKALHRRLSREMKHDLEVIRSFGPPTRPRRRTA